MKTQIPESVLPQTIGDPNALTTYYTTNILYPKIGPLAVNRHVTVIAKLLRDYAESLHTVDLIVDYNRRFDTSVKIIQQPAPWLQEDIIYKPLLSTSSSYLKSFVMDLSPFRDPKAILPSEDVLKPKNTFSDTPNFHVNPVLIADPHPNIANISAISDIQAGDIKLINERIVSKPIGLVDLIKSKEKFKDVSFGEVVEMREHEAVQYAEHQERAYKLGNVMHGLARVNAVIPEMLQKGILSTEDSLLNADLSRDNNYQVRIAELLAEQYELAAQRLQEVGRLVDQAIAYLESLGLQDVDFIKKYRTNDKFKRDVRKFIIGKLDKIKTIDNRRLPLPSEGAVVKTREWAFQRSEKLELFIKKPIFKGPFNAEAVSPNSELTISESRSDLQFSERSDWDSATAQTTSEQGVLTSNRFKLELANMTENGVMDESSFDSQSALFNSLNERRRETIDRTLTNISKENEQRIISGSQVRSNSTRSYTTKGKDAKFATTELSFQVVTPVDVRITLEDVNLVWAPHIPSPFMHLHRIIRRHKNQARIDYIRQNYVVDPSRPIIEYERATIEKELAVKGKDRYQTGSFNFLVGAQYQGNGWELDPSSCEIDYRNGTKNDYNWNERWNWDDLENWDTHYKTIAQDGDRIKGIAVLETTDPEKFNKGFFTFKFVMKRMTEASKAALRVYNNDQMVAAKERRAVLARARQYAKLKEEELIQKYENRINLQHEVFDALIQEVFQGQDPEYFGYYKEIIRSCINWNKVGIHFDSNDTVGLPFPEFSRSHFMNTTGVRFILPILHSAESNFISSIRANGSDYYMQSVKQVQKLTADYRKQLQEFRTHSPEKLILDKYSNEVVIGRHLEAVISTHSFTNDDD